jgi:[ribosomal protein S5]-alanine N-acetyltransferase
MNALHTPRLEIRPWTQADVGAFHAIWGDPEVIFWGAAKDREASSAVLEKFLARCAGRPWPVAWHAVMERVPGDVVGNAMLEPARVAAGEAVGNVVLQPAAFAPGDLEVGWHLRRDAWGRGYASEAARALIDEAFARLPIDRLTCAILPDNHRSQRVAARLAFTRVGPIVHAGLPHDLLEVRRPRPA